MLEKYFCTFPFDVSEDDLPDSFTYPFYYKPHPLCIKASKILQEKILSTPEFSNHFKDQKGGWKIGKMMGVMIVKNEKNDIGYLCAFSGKIDERSVIYPFVPPVYNFADKTNFYRKGELILNEMNVKIEQLEQSEDYARANKKLSIKSKDIDQKLNADKAKMKTLKLERDRLRKTAKEKLPITELAILEEKLKNESLGQQFAFKEYQNYLMMQKAELQKEVDMYKIPLQQLRKDRKALSQKLQDQLFESYTFLNARREENNLKKIFQSTFFKTPPSGAGDCAAPKLLQFAYKNNLQPVAIAEFWWGKSPAQEIRKHKLYYPACRGKCEPILGHMLEGLDVDPNPMLTNPALGKILDIIYEDKYMLAVNKPADFLSVPGKNIEDSVWLRMKHKYPDATGPLIIHRLDMSTSGILLIAKSSDIYKPLQKQFMTRDISKSYVAVLEGIIETDNGIIDLPLRGDFYDRPRQIVCHEHGKSSRTKWETIKRLDNKTKVRFYPITGRTHQLRVHAAHPEGLNLAIVGDDLYGQSADRLYLHAEEISFTHPVTQERVHLKAVAPF